MQNDDKANNLSIERGVAMNQENVRGSSWNKRTFSMLNFVLLLLAIPVFLIVDGIMLLVNAITKLGRLFAVKVQENQN
jgi:hypothetical protein